jgi:short-subunit dehydrogenase
VNPAAANDWRDRVVWLTGASSGLGAVLAETLASRGARLGLFARSRGPLEKVAALCRARGAEVVAVPGDVTKEAEVGKAVREVVEKFERLDVCIAAAGLSMWARFEDVTDPEPLHQVMRVNYGGIVNCAFHTLPELKRSGGVFAAVSSIQGKVGVPCHTGYAASKHAVQGFCDSLRLELRGTNVTVLTVMAHWIRGTQLRERALGRDGAPRGAASLPHGREAVPVAAMGDAILRAIANRQREIFVPAKLRYLAWLTSLLPTWGERIVLGRVQRESRSEAGS